MKAGENHLTTGLRSGTSLAAPLVSFAAALVLSESSFTGARLKKRILASADLDDKFASVVVDGRRLNIVKATAVTLDVLEFGGQVRFGTVRFMQGEYALQETAKIGFQCNENHLLTVQVQNVLKFARYGGTNEKPLFKLYYEKGDIKNESVSFEEDICQMPAEEDWWLSFQEHDSTSKEKVPMLQLRDFVKASL